MARTTAQIALTFISLILGVLLVAQFRTQTRMAKAMLAESAADQATIISNLIEANSKLRDEVAQLESGIESYAQTNSSSTSLDSLEADLTTLRIVNGLSEVSGQGVEIQVNGDMTVVEMQDMMNELRNAGAEALAVNGLRVVVRSSVTAEQSGGIRLDGVVISSPYLFEATGESETLERALERKGGLVSLLRYNYSDSAVRVAKRDRLVLPAFKGNDTFNYVKQAPTN